MRVELEIREKAGEERKGESDGQLIIVTVWSKAQVNNEINDFDK